MTIPSLTSLVAGSSRRPRRRGGIDKVDSVDIYVKAKSLNIEEKHRTLTVLAQTLFTEKILKEIEGKGCHVVQGNSIYSSKH